VAEHELCVEALRAALGSSARDGATAASAAEALVEVGDLAPDDPQLDGLLSRAPFAERGGLAQTLLRRRRDLTGLVPHFVALLGQSDERIASEALDAMSFDTERRTTVLEQALAIGVHPAVLDRVRHGLGRPTSSETYFADAPRHEDAPQ
jgi:hypothetical protein